MAGMKFMRSSRRRRAVIHGIPAQRPRSIDVISTDERLVDAFLLRRGQRRAADEQLFSNPTLM